MIEYKKMTASELKTLFYSFMVEKYGFVPSFKVEIYAFFALPVLIEFDKQDESFEEFYSKFEYDMFSVPDKEYCMGDESDYGDKLLELIYSHSVTRYDIVGANIGDDVLFEEVDDEGAILISIDKSKPIHFLKPS